MSWTKEVKKARKGESSVSLYDAEGYSAVKRARRSAGSATLYFVRFFSLVYSGVVSQVSWTKEVKKARKGESSVSLYDAEGYSALKRSRERGEADSLAPLLTIVVSYPGSYSKILLNFVLFLPVLSIRVGLYADPDPGQTKRS